MRPQSRGVIRPRFSSTSALFENRGRREDRVRAAPAVSCANMHKNTHTSIQVQRRHPAFPAQWFTAYFALSPVTGFLATVIPEKRLLLTNLTPASGRQDHTTSPSASALFVNSASASTASRPAFRDVAQRPSCRVRRAESNH